MVGTATSCFSLAQMVFSPTVIALAYYILSNAKMLRLYQAGLEDVQDDEQCGDAEWKANQIVAQMTVPLAPWPRPLVGARRGKWARTRHLGAWRAAERVCLLAVAQARDRDEWGDWEWAP